METTSELTKEQLEHLSLYLLCFKKAYYIQTGKKLETVDQIIDTINEGVFEFEDVFTTYLDQCCNEIGEEDSYFLDYNIERFNCENYFPSSNKKVNEGKWIKLRTSVGFEVHFARTSNRKRRFSEELEKIEKKLSSLFNSQLKGLQDSNKKVDEVITPAKKKKAEELQNQISELRVRMLIGLRPYEVRINRTKTKVEYYHPYQYEIVEDIQEFSDAYVNKITGVNVKSLYTSQNEDAVFYLRSRGISERAARMLALLKQTYFIVDMNKAIDEYNRQIREAVVFVNGDD